MKPRMKPLFSFQDRISQNSEKAFSRAFSENILHMKDQLLLLINEVERQRVGDILRAFLSTGYMFLSSFELHL